MVRRLHCLLAMGVVLLCFGLLKADGPSRGDLEPYAVRIARGPGSDGIKGAGVYLGRGLVLTAAHVAGSQQSPVPLFVEAGHRFLAARYVKRGTFDDVDVTLLAVDAAALPPSMQGLKGLDLCAKPPVPGETVAVIGNGRTSYSSIVSAKILPKGVPLAFDTLILDVDTTGNSGSGVFDDRRGCLAGIMSRKIERFIDDADAPGGRKAEPVAKYFVPAAAIREFMAGLSLD